MKRDFNPPYKRKIASSHSPATLWDDLRVPAQNTRINPAKAEPAFEEFTDGLYTYKFDPTNADDESIHFATQMPHSYQEGSNFRAHVHWSPDTDDKGDIVWQLEYIIANIDGTFPGGATSIKVTVPADGTALKHQVAYFDGDIDGTGLLISHMLICRLTRLTSDSDDTFTGNACFLEFDFHFQKDMIGSHEELIK